MDLAVEMHPSLVIAIDYLFWYVYGDDDGRGQRLKNEADRLGKLELGLQQLDRLDATTPLVVGDISDMSRAVGKMISASQMPDVDIIKKANERIRAWAEKRGHVVVFPLADLVEQLKSGKPVTMGGITFASDKGRLIQSDDLHPTMRGSIALALAIAERVNAAFAGEQKINVVADEASATKRLAEAAAALVDARLKKPAK
jgi:hypothetical protein